jgi:hypothetical protein
MYSYLVTCYLVPSTAVQHSSTLIYNYINYYGYNIELNKLLTLVSSKVLKIKIWGKFFMFKDIGNIGGREVVYLCLCYIARDYRIDTTRNIKYTTILLKCCIHIFIYLFAFAKPQAWQGISLSEIIFVLLFSL